MSIGARLLLCALALGNPPAWSQEAPPVTLEKKATLQDLAAELQTRTGARLQIDSSVENKVLDLALKKVSFFEAVDQICRVHGAVRYFEPPTGGGFGELTLRAGAWTEYPTSYDPSFKVIVSDLARVKSQVADAEREWCRLYAVLFGPPWIPVDYASGARMKWSISEAVDADGRSVLEAKGEREPEQRIDFAFQPTISKGNVAARALFLRSFDIDRGLKLVRGTVEATLADTSEATLILEVGKAVDTPVGRIVVNAAKEHDRNADGTIWRVGLTLEPKNDRIPLGKVLEGRFRYPGSLGTTWTSMELPLQGHSFDALITREAALPKELTLRVRQGERKTVIPFEFRDVSFKKG
jgi:hypothetical protein